MSTLKRFSRLFSLPLLLVLGFTACGSPTTTTQNASPAPAAAAATAAPATGANASAVELTMWTWKVAHVPGLEAIAKNFEAKTGIKVTVSAFNPDEAYRTKITTGAQSGDLPDVLAYWSTSQFDLAQSGQLVELTNQVDTAWKSNFLAGTYDTKSVISQTQYDTCQKDPKCTTKDLKVGQSFSVPLMAGTAGFVYANKELLTKSGLDPNTPPKTAEEWLAMMKTVKEKTGQAGLVTGEQNADVAHFWLYQPLLITNCGQETYDAIYNGKDSFTNPCSQQVFNFIDQIGKNGLWLPGILQTNIDPADVAFAQGKAGFDIGGTYTLSFLLQQGMKAENVLTFAIPPLGGAKLSKLELGASPLIDVAVTKSSKHQAEAIEFLKFMTTPEQAVVFAKIVGDVPAVRIPADPAQVGSAVVGLVGSLSDKSPFITSKAQLVPETRKAAGSSLQQMISGDITPEAVAKQIDDANKAGWAAKGGS